MTSSGLPSKDEANHKAKCRSQVVAIVCNFGVIELSDPFGHLIGYNRPRALARFEFQESFEKGGVLVAVMALPEEPN